MEANILEGIYIQIGGAAGKTNGLAYHILENMTGHLQDLIISLAKYELDTDQSPNLKEFEIELFDFKPGSAVPAFRIIPKEQKLFPIILEQKSVVANKFDSLMAQADKGTYDLFFSPDTLTDIRYEIGEDLFGFILSAENSPLAIVKPLTDRSGKIIDFRKVYNVPKFTTEQTNYLLRPRKIRQKAQEPERMLALVQRIGKRKRIIDIYENKDTVLSIAPTEIITENKKYILHNPLFCAVQKDEENFIVQNEILDIYAAGFTIDEAEHDFYKEFDESYELLMSLPDEQLSDRLLRAKTLMITYIKEIVKE